MKLVKQFKVNKTRMTFKMNITKLMDKYSKVMNSSVKINFQKTHFKDIKEVCDKISDEFK